MKNCSLITLQKYIDNELDIKNLAVFNKHLASCAGCQKNLELLKKEEEFLNNIILEKPSVDFTDNVMKAVRETHIQKSPGIIPQILVCLFLMSLITAVYAFMPDYNLKIMTDLFTNFLMITLKTAKIFFSSILDNSFTRAFINPLFSIFKKNIFSIAIKVTVVESIMILFVFILWSCRRIGSRGASARVI